MQRHSQLRRSRPIGNADRRKRSWNLIDEEDEAEAQAEAAAVLQINPKWSLEVWKQRVPYKDPAMLERVYSALRKAGLE